MTAATAKALAGSQSVQQDSCGKDWQEPGRHRYYVIGTV